MKNAAPHHKKQPAAAGYKGAKRRMCGGAWASGESQQRWRNRQPIKRRGERRTGSKSKKSRIPPIAEVVQKKPWHLGASTTRTRPGTS